jgi:hypothetical protein
VTSPARPVLDATAALDSLAAVVRQRDAYRRLLAAVAAQHGGILHVPHDLVDDVDPERLVHVETATGHTVQCDGRHY